MLQQLETFNGLTHKIDADLNFVIPHYYTFILFVTNIKQINILSCRLYYGTPKTKEHDNQVAKERPLAISESVVYDGL